jgi:hypothetical protein
MFDADTHHKEQGHFADKVSGRERKEVIWGSRILHNECVRCEVLTVINIEIQ